jgi:hypothetical protein
LLVTNLGAFDGRLAHGLADLCLVAVHLGGVDVSVTDFQRGEGGPFRVGRINLEDAKSELGYLDPVVESDGGNGGCRLGHAHKVATRMMQDPRLPT